MTVLKPSVFRFSRPKFPASIQDIIFEQVRLARALVGQCEPVYERVHVPGWRDEASINHSDPPLETQLTAYQNLHNADGVSQPTARTGQDIFVDLSHCECRWFRSWQLLCAQMASMDLSFLPILRRSHIYGRRMAMK